MNKLFAPLVLAGLLPLSCLAADETPNYAEETLTGDWGGARAALWRKGLALDIGYKTDLLRNMSGGIEKGGRPMTHLEFKLKADFDKLLNWSGGTGYLALIHDGGGKLNALQVGSLTGVSNIEVPTSTHRLFHAWVQQEFAAGQGALLVGLYPIDSEFQVLDAAAVFVQPPYGASADLSLTRTPSIFNNSSFGFRGKWFSVDRGAYVQGAVMDGIPGDPANPRGTHVRFDKGDGVMSIVELGFKPGAALGGETAAIEKYAAGLWRYSLRVPDQVDASVNRLSRGWYVLAEKTLHQGRGGSDLAGFLRISGTDGDSTAIKRAVNVGVRATAPLPGRGEDVFGLAFTRASLSDKWRGVQSAFATSAVEDAWEITYRIQANKWLALQPVAQRISHPGGDSSRPAARILGARIEISL
jgi:porin